MANFNKVLLMGNLTRDPQLRYLPSQMAVVDFGLAVNRRWKGPQGEDREEVTFVDCTAWAKQAETINQYFQKGKPIFIEGRLKYDTWEDKQGGGKRSRLVVVVENFQFIGGRDGGAGGGGAPAGAPQAAGNEYDQRPQRPAAPARPQAAPAAPQRPPAEPPIGEEQQFKDEDIPF
jgi:single-strand DNA-binding protein